MTNSRFGDDQNSTAAPSARPTTALRPIAEGLQLTVGSAPSFIRPDYAHFRGGTDAAVRSTTCLCRPCRSCDIALRACGGTAEIPDRHELAEDAAEPLDRRPDRRHFRRLPGSHLDHPPSRNLDRPRKTRRREPQREMLRLRAPRHRVRSGRQRRSGLGWPRPGL